MSEPRREFVPVKDPKEAAKLLNEGAKMHASAILWTSDQTHHIQTQIISADVTKGVFTAWLPDETDIQDLNDFLSEEKPGACYVSLSLAGANVFFKALVISVEPGVLKARWPEHVFKVQRRADFRFTVPSGQVLKLKFKDPTDPANELERRIVDLSAGGLSYRTEPEDEGKFFRKQPLTGLEFVVGEIQIKVDAVVSNVVDGPAARVGVSFKDLTLGTQSQLSSYLFSETRKIFSRYF